LAYAWKAKWPINVRVSTSLWAGSEKEVVLGIACSIPRGRQQPTLLLIWEEWNRQATADWIVFPYGMRQGWERFSEAIRKEDQSFPIPMREKLSDWTIKQSQEETGLPAITLYGKLAA
jgi:hypothetical protein